MKVCSKCGKEKLLDDFYVRSQCPEHQRMYWCKKCINDKARERESAIKKRAVALMGGKCVNCGYSKCIRALEFHHTNPDNKHRSSSYGSPRGWCWKRYWEEVSKCILLCANCHREEEERLNLLRHST